MTLATFQAEVRSCIQDHRTHEGWPKLVLCLLCGHEIQQTRSQPATGQLGQGRSTLRTRG